MARVGKRVRARQTMHEISARRRRRRERELLRLLRSGQLTPVRGTWL